MTVTYEAIATVTLTTPTNSVSFTSIPATYTDILLVMSFTETTAATNTNGYFTFNTDTYNSQTNYSFTRLEGNGSVATSTRSSNTGSIFWGYDVSGSVFTTTLCNIMNYSNTNTNKTILMRQSNASEGSITQVGLWRNTSAINAINIYGSDQVGVPTADPFSTGSIFTLYGIKSE